MVIQILWIMVQKIGIYKVLKNVVIILMLMIYRNFRRYMQIFNIFPDAGF